jgi:ketosteroid isomerase-like protein
MPSENVQSLQAGYDAFARGDVDGVMELLRDDVEWITPESTPLSGRYHGKQEVMGFFGKLAELTQELSVEPREFIDAADAVLVVCRIRGRGRNGTIDMDAAHLWRMRDGKASGFHEFADTAQLAAALGEPATARAGR